LIKSLLIDLDDTLLDTNMGEFLPAYFDRLASHLSDLAPRERLIACLLQAVQAMNGNLDPTRTLKSAFDELFYPALGVTEADVHQRVVAFYEKEFPTLRQLTRSKDEAPDFIRAAREAEYELVLATNPLFPRSAITQRLDWAGVPAKASDFDLVTSYENAHFTKPNPEYYAEILGKLGRPCAEAVMIGDNQEADLAPAVLLGMQAFHVTQTPNGGFPGGSLSAATTWLRQDDAADAYQESGPATPRQVLARLRGYLAALLGLTDGIPQDEWNKRASTSEWSPVEIVCHLRDVELEVNHVRIEQILEQPSPFLSAADPDQWAGPRRYLDQNPQQALGRFVEARVETISRLAALDEEAWRLPARHALFGPTTLTELVSLAADHDLVHLDQLHDALAES
jgi:HAD superfamily hydrolase (TIGR01549 family)